MGNGFNCFSGAILAGGKNKRMNGIAKSFIRIQDTPIIRKTIDILKSIFEEIIIVTNSPSDYKAYNKDCRIVSDIIKDSGPPGGIHSALSYASRDAVFVVACDMPFLHNGLIVRLLDAAKEDQVDCLIPCSERGPEPLHGVYSKSIIPKLENAIKKREFCIASILEQVNCKYVKAKKEEQSSFININSPEDLQEAWKSTY